MGNSTHSELLKEHGTFTREELEISGNPLEDYSPGFLEHFLQWRGNHGYATLVSSGVRPGDQSAHPEGYAIDCILFDQWLQKPVDPISMFWTANNWGFLGVGLYFDWRWNRNDPATACPGVHVDVWPDPDRRPLRWMAGRLGGKREFFYLSEKTGKWFNQEYGSYSFDQMIDYLTKNGMAV